MRYFVTGASGFIGSAIVRAALNAGHSVSVLARGDATLTRLCDVADRITVVRGSFSDLSAPATRDAIHAVAPDVVVHAGWEGVSGTDRNAEWQSVRNVPAAFELLMLAADAGAGHFIGLGSQAEYGPCSGRVAEDQPLKPTTMYGHAKVAACTITERAARLRVMKHSWLRVFSTYGAGSEPGWVLPMTASAIARGIAPDLTPCEQRWEFLHVSDAANAVIAIANVGANGIFNLGNGEAHSLRDVILELRDHIDPAVTPNFGAVAYRPDQVMHLEAVITRLRRATGWMPKISLDLGLEEIAREAVHREALEHHGHLAHV